MNQSIKKLQIIIIIFISFITLISNAPFPNGNKLNSNLETVREKLKKLGYNLGRKKMHFLLQEKYKVEFIISPPSYMIDTAIGIAGDGTAKKMKILIFKVPDISNPQDLILIEGYVTEDNIFIKQIKDKSYHYLIEIDMIDREVVEEYTNVELVYGFYYKGNFDPPPVQKITTDDEIPSGKAGEIISNPCIPTDRTTRCGTAPDQQYNKNF